MKAGKSFSLTSIILFTILLLNSSCKKNGIKDIFQENGIHSVDTAANRPPVAFAGPDQMVQLPIDYIVLSGDYKTENNFDRVQWKKLSGPSCLIENQDTLLTKVSGLKAGTYQFELTVFDQTNMSGKDAVTVTVNPLPARITIGDHFVIYDSLTWIFPWYASLEAKNIYAYVQQNAQIQVFLQRGSSNDWIQIQSESYDANIPYEYFIESSHDGAGMYTYGSLYVFYYGKDTDDHARIRVEF